MTPDAVLSALNHARKVVTFHRKLVSPRHEARGPARGREQRVTDIADVVTDLRHLAQRYGIRWSEILEKVDAYMVVDQEGL